MDRELFYKSKAWRYRREHVLRRDGYLCQNCKRYGRWIDRYYIALEDDSSSGFRYLYLTRWHAEETLRDHRGLLRMRQTSVLDSQTLAMYDAALNSMRVERRGYITYPLQA